MPQGRGRPPKEEKFARLVVSVPETVYNQFYMACFDPMTQRVKYGVMGEVVTTLLRQWLSRTKRPNNPPESAA